MYSTKSRKDEYDKIIQKSLELIHSAAVSKKRPLTLAERAAETLKKPKIEVNIQQIKTIRTLLDTKFKRYEVQKILHDKFVNVILRVVFKDLLDKYPDQIREILHIDDFTQEVIVTAPRRFGKTWAVAMIVAVLLVVLPNIRVAVFSTGKRASQALMQMVKQYLKGNPFNLNDKLFQYDREDQIWMKYGTNDTRKFYAYPGSVHT